MYTMPIKSTHGPVHTHMRAHTAEKDTITQGLGELFAGEDHSSGPE